MASFWFHLALIMACLSSLLLNSKASNSLPSSPAMYFTNPPPSSFQELSPEITPLLPSPGGVVPTPTTSSVSTIPSNPSPPNPDDEPAAAGSVFSAIAPMPATSAASTRTSLQSSQYFAASAGLAGFVWIL